MLDRTYIDNVIFVLHHHHDQHYCHHHHDQEYRHHHDDQQWLSGAMSALLASQPSLAAAHPRCALALSYTDGNFHHCPQMETFFALSPTDGNFHYISIHRWKLFSLHYQTIITALSSTDGNYRHYNLECLQHHAQILSHFMLVCITVHNSTQPKSLFIIISI